MDSKTAIRYTKRKIRRILRVGVTLCIILGPLFAKSTISAETLTETGILAPVQGPEDPAIIAVRDALLVDNFTSARAGIKVLFQKSQKSGQAEYWAGVLCLRTGASDDAIRYLRASQKLKDNAYTDEALALAYYSARQFKLFLALMSRANQRMPSNFAPYYYLGRYYVSVEVADFQRAEVLLSKAIQYDPTNARSIYYLALCQESAGGLEKAESSYKQVLNMPHASPHYLDLAELGLARVTMSTNRHAEAFIHAQKVEAALPQEVEAHTILARLYAERGDSQKAVSEWKVAKSLDPTNTSAYYNLYRLYLRAGDKTLADEAFKQYKAISKLYGTD